MPKKPTNIHSETAQKYGKKKPPFIAGISKVVRKAKPQVEVSESVWRKVPTEQCWTYSYPYAERWVRETLSSIDHRLSAITWLLVIIAASVIGLGILNLV